MKTTFNRLALLASLVLTLGLLNGLAGAHPLPGRDILKFSQKPMDATPVAGALFWGHDELSTAYAPMITPNPPSYRGTFMADDFADKFTSPVVHVRWWGSYLNNSHQFGKITKFLIAFEADQPQGPGAPFSYPIPPIHAQIVDLGALAPGSGTFTETQVSGGGSPLFEDLFEYNAELALPFAQQADTVHWLKIVALVDHNPALDPNDPTSPLPRWGWHNRDYTQQNPLASAAVLPGEQVVGTIGNSPIWHFQDNAVTGLLDVFTAVNSAGAQVVQQVQQYIPTFHPTYYLDIADGPQGIGQYSKDLAFELFTVPEPASCLLGWGALATLAAVRRRTQR
ncbi:MAG TPA: hypothetical protein PJ982_12610 [Lacipirellulaceae bacterium]|nr:hypothetical protein [Lacipirellulaceae bacterium]